MNSMFLIKVSEILCDNDLAEYQTIEDINYLSKDEFYTMSTINALEDVYDYVKQVEHMDPAIKEEIYELLDTVINSIADRVGD